MLTDNSPAMKDLVLIGGGHSHLFVLRYFAMRPQPGLRLTLITRDLHTPYSGMLPGWVAGHYDRDETHIDLAPLAQMAAARLIHAEVDSIDAANRLISLPGRPPISYDLLSINIGSRPTWVPGDASNGREFAVKPVDGFMRAWRSLEQRLHDEDQDLRLAIVGGGAGGVELALALQHRVGSLSAKRGGLNISLVTDRERLLPSHNDQVQTWFADLLPERGIDVFYRCAVQGFDGRRLSGDFDAPIPADAVIWATQASAPEWLRQSGLALDEQGFVAVNPALQSRSHEEVFAAGDIASVQEHPRPRSGVFAVRQGIPLARNLRRRAQGLTPLDFTPQNEFLSLISTGDRYAIASRGRWALRGRWCWWLKDWIDRRFMRQFSLPNREADDEEASQLAPMRCAGCGSKLGSRTLQQVLTRLERDYSVEVNMADGQADDAAILDPPAGQQLVQSVDHFRSFIRDPYLFGRIVANHALGDLYAMGVEAHSALVVANVEFGREERQAEDLLQLMSGVAESLSEDGARLIGGHSGEAQQMSCGLTVNGFAPRERLLLKSGLQPGQKILLTRALGSGTLFAADMRGLARGEWLYAALHQLLVSNRAAAACLRRHGATACTDVTGFGLLGHLFEMVQASSVAVRVTPGDIPVFAGALELSARGVQSSLQPQNRRFRHALLNGEREPADPRYGLLFDPQTAGGLLAGVPAANATDCRDELRAGGYPDASIIGEVYAAKGEEIGIRLDV